MANEVIPIGSKIEMQLAERRTLTKESGITEVYISQFLQWSEVNVAVIAVPTYQGRIVPLRIDDIYELQFVTRSGLYRCKGKF